MKQENKQEIEQSKSRINEGRERSINPQILPPAEDLYQEGKETYKWFMEVASLKENNEKQRPNTNKKTV